MTPHKTITLKDGTLIQIKYWSNGNMICVAGFDSNENQISVATYQATVEYADDFYPSFQKSLIEGLVEIVEGDLIRNPEMHLRK